MWVRERERGRERERKGKTRASTREEMEPDIYDSTLVQSRDPSIRCRILLVIHSALQLRAAILFIQHMRQSKTREVTYQTVQT